MARTNLLVAATGSSLAFACGLGVLGEAGSIDPTIEAGTFASSGSTSPSSSSSSSSGSGETDGPARLLDAGNEANASRAAVDAGRDAAAGCTEVNARTFNGHCYFVLTSGNRADGDAKCKALGAKLVSITTPQEQTAIESMGTGDRWIGLFATAPTNNNKNNFQWPDGSAGTTYDHWKSSNPDGNTSCVVLDRGDNNFWTDRDCNDGAVKEALCERG